jgi:NTP pyrophosphatase (non-canonical NTP hydrolase)
VFVDFDEYQQLASRSDQIEKREPRDAIAAMLGLASETGSILNLYKKHLRDGVDLHEQRGQLAEELGDALWYLATIARAFDLSLNDIAEMNLRRTSDLYAGDDERASPLVDFEAGYPAQERFPRQMVVEFRDERLDDGRSTVSLYLVEARPNSFPEGKVRLPGVKRPIGFAIGERLGDPLRDNSPVPDEYRFHDAVHMSFMAILGWSATFRSHLRVKRKSQPEVDDTEDSARSSFREEGLVAVLAQLAEPRRGFETVKSVDATVLSVVDAVMSGLEVATHPRWLWRRAISDGFRMLRGLRDHGGGYLAADLDSRTIAFHSTWPSAEAGASAEAER